MRISGVTYASRKTHKLRNFIIIVIILAVIISVLLFFMPDLRTSLFDFFKGIAKTFPFWKE